MDRNGAQFTVARLRQLVQYHYDKADEARASEKLHRELALELEYAVVVASAIDDGIREAEEENRG